MMVKLMKQLILLTSSDIEQLAHIYQHPHQSLQKLLVPLSTSSHFHQQLMHPERDCNHSSSNFFFNRNMLIYNESSSVKNNIIKIDTS